MSDFSRRIAGKGSQRFIRGGGSSNERRPKTHGGVVAPVVQSLHLSLMMGIGVPAWVHTLSQLRQACSQSVATVHSAPSCSPSCGGCGSHFQVSNRSRGPSPHIGKLGIVPLTDVIFVLRWQWIRIGRRAAGPAAA